MTNRIKATVGFVICVSMGVVGWLSVNPGKIEAG
jgi:hypothetical protein